MNLEEIARLSHKSRSTVSRVINNDPHLSDATRTAVMEVVQRVNFHPNAAARSLAAGRTRVLGLVIPTGVSALFTDPYFPLLVQGVAQACNAHDHSVMLWLAEPEYERRTIGQVLHGGLIDGVILASVLTGDPLLQALTGADATVPFVLVGRQPGNDRLNYVDVDNINSAREAVTHLLRQGRRRVATITGLLNTNVGIDRRDGYLAALRQRSLPVDPDLIVESDFTEAGGYGAMQRLLPCRPDAVFAASDMMAMGALRALREAGRRVPQDVVVATRYDGMRARTSKPALTAVDLHLGEVGERAIELLLEHLRGDTGRQAVQPVEPTLVVRRSSQRR